MRTHALLLSLAICSALACSRSEETPDVAAAPPPIGEIAPGDQLMQVMRVVQGEPTGFEIRDGALHYCEADGPRAVDLVTARRSVPERDCQAARAPNPSCSGLGREIRVRPGAGQGTDAVDAGGRSFVVGGRVRDCAADGDLLAIATERAVGLIDLASGRMVHVRTNTGGERVAVGAGWVGWTEGSIVNAEPIRGRMPGH